jgi:hypothetical protein
MKNLLLYVFGCLFLFGVFLHAQEKPNIQRGTEYPNDSLNYQMLGYEQHSMRFWIVIDPKFVSNKLRMRNIIQHVYCRNRFLALLDSSSWCISFFANSKEAGYKTFKSESYLAEYSREDNKVKVYPAIGKRTYWFYGPDKWLKCK